MIDVIIPTLMKTNIDIFTYTLNVLNSCDIISRIIIIDNTVDKLFKQTFSNLSDKFIIVDSGENTYVNPSWNIGVSMCESPNYLLLNDDILCCDVTLKHTDYLLNNESLDCGIVTVKTVQSVGISDFNNINNSISTEIVEFDYNIPNGGRIGWYMAGRVLDWVDIPPEFKLFYGDDMIYDYVKSINKPPVIITNSVISHFESTTTKQIVWGQESDGYRIYRHELELWNQKKWRLM